MYALVHSVVLLVSPQAGVAQATPDTARERKQLGAAARTYEHALRTYAPFGIGISGGTCDEQVGRFCVVYEHGRSGPPVEPRRVAEERAKVIAAFRRGLAVLGPDSMVAAGLARYLAEADSGGAVVAMAARASGVWQPLLSGFGLFLDRRTAAAEVAFSEAMAVLDSVERRRALDLAVLLAPRERARLQALSAGARVEYVDRLWRLADPLYLTAGNEAWAEHLSRYVWSRILARAPVGSNATSWGWDIEELTRRFGVPKGRTKQMTASVARDRVTDWFDPQQMTYVPPELIERALTIYVPGDAWPYDTIRSRSGFAPPTVRDMSALEHQLSVFRGPTGSTLRVDARLVLDTLVARPARVEFGLFVLDSTFARIGEARTMVDASGDSAIAAVSLPLPAEAFAYSVEALEPTSRLAARSRYRLPTSTPNALLLSDPVLLRVGGNLPGARGELKPLTSLVLQRDTRIAVYLESAHLRSTDYRVELSIEEAAKPGAVTRALRRVGAWFGRERIRPRVTWSARADAGEVTAISFGLGELRLPSGLHRLIFNITQSNSGVTAVVERVVRIK